MKTQEFKKLIKDAVREAIQEELKDILLEAVRAPRTSIIETPVGVGSSGVTNSPNLSPKGTPHKSTIERKAMMESIMGDMRRGQDTLSFNSTNAITANTLQISPGMNTSGEGTALPSGNVGLDMIMGLMSKK